MVVLFCYIGKLTGMNENQDTFAIPSTNKAEKALLARVGEAANVQIVPASEPSKLSYCFAAKTISSATLVLVQVKLTEDADQARLKVNCEKMVIGSMLVKELKKALTKV